MDPVEALDEIAYRLERDLASSYKTKAFRTAGTIIAAMPASEVAAQAASGALKSVKGIGGTTYEVIREAVEGRVPQYLADLRASETPLAEGGAAVRAALRGDLHSHTDWSDGTTPIQLMAATARRLGHEYLAITDHSPHLRVANGLTSERLDEQLDVIADLNRASGDLRLLTGIEVDILDDGALDQSTAMLARVDIVVASVHSKLKMPAAQMTERMLAAIRNPYTRVLGHVTGQLVMGSRGTRPQSQFDAAAVFAACAEEGVAVEINSRPERRDPPDDLLRLAIEAGCLFSIDSDAHAPGQLGLLDLGAERAEAAGIPVQRIVNTWERDALLEWAGS